MINGYVTLEEMHLITGIELHVLRWALTKGVRQNFIACEGRKWPQPLYNFKDAECWLRICLD